MLSLQTHQQLRCAKPVSSKALIHQDMPYALLPFVVASQPMATSTMIRPSKASPNCSKVHRPTPIMEMLHRPPVLCVTSWDFIKMRSLCPHRERPRPELT